MQSDADIASSMLETEEGSFAAYKRLLGVTMEQLEKEKLVNPDVGAAFLKVFTPQMLDRWLVVSQNVFEYLYAGPRKEALSSFPLDGLQILRFRWTIASNSLQRQNLIEYPIVNLKLNLREEKESQIHIPSWKLHFVSHLCSEV